MLNKSGINLRYILSPPPTTHPPSRHPPQPPKSPPHQTQIPGTPHPRLPIQAHPFQPRPPKRTEPSANPPPPIHSEYTPKRSNFTSTNQEYPAELVATRSEHVSVHIGVKRGINIEKSNKRGAKAKSPPSHRATQNKFIGIIRPYIE
jgi:hypothetical protein